VDGTVDPSTTLTEQDFKRVRDDRFTYCLGNEDLLASGKSFQHQRRQVSIFSQQQQVLLVQCVDNVLLVSRHDIRIRENGNEIPGFSFRRFDP
jgi:hypothetical protein